MVSLTSRFQPLSFFCKRKNGFRTSFLVTKPFRQFSTKELYKGPIKGFKMKLYYLDSKILFFFKADPIIKEKILQKKGLIIDMDGVIYHADKLLPGVKTFLTWLQNSNKQFLILNFHN